MLSCFYEMVDKKRKISNSFRNMSYENKLLKLVKLIDRLVMNVINLRLVTNVKKKQQSFSLQRYSSKNKWNLWYFKKVNLKHKESALALNGGRKTIYIDNFNQRSLSRLILSFFYKTSLQLPTLDIILAECK